MSDEMCRLYRAAADEEDRTAEIERLDKEQLEKVYFKWGKDELEENEETFSIDEVIDKILEKIGENHD